jgi:hypothetical protein
MSIATPGGFAKTEQDAMNDAKAMRLRSLGWSYQKIADNLGVSKTAAYKRVQRALAAIPFEAVEEYRRIEVSRLDQVLEVAMEKALNPDNKAAMFAIDRVLTIMDRRAKLLGLDAPTKNISITMDALDMEIARLSAELGVNGHELTARVLSEISDGGDTPELGEGTQG